MTFAIKKDQAFRELEATPDLIPRRSEGRLKKIDSATDARAWHNDDVERTNHLLELILKDRRKCSNLIPLETLVNILQSLGKEELKKLSEDLQLIREFLDCELTPEQKEKLETLLLGEVTIEEVCGRLQLQQRRLTGEEEAEEIIRELKSEEKRRPEEEAVQEICRELEWDSELEECESEKYVDECAPETIEDIKCVANEAIDKLNLLEEICEDRDRLQEALACSEREVDMLKQSYQISQEKLETLKEGMTEMHTRALEQKEEDCERLRREAECLREQVNHLKASQEQLVSDNEKERSHELEKLNELKQNFDKCKSELEEAICKTKKQEARIKDLEKERDTLRDSMVENSECSKLIKQKVCLEAKLKELQVIEAKYNESAPKLADLELIKQERDAFENKYHELLKSKSELEATQAKIAKLKDVQQENTVLLKKLHETECCLAYKEEEVDRLLCEIKKLASVRDQGQKQLEDTLNDICTEMDKKNAELSEASHKLNELQRQMEVTICRVQEEANTLKQKISDLEDEVDDLRLTLQQKNKTIECLMSEIDKKEGTINCLREEIKTPQSKPNSRRRTKCSGCPMGDQLKSFKEETIKMEQCASEITNVAADRHILELLEQSKVTVNKLSTELKKHYKC